MVLGESDLKTVHLPSPTLWIVFSVFSNNHSRRFQKERVSSFLGVVVVVVVTITLGMLLLVSFL